MTRYLLLALLLAPIAAGCGSNNPTTSTATASGNPDVTAAYAYARCIRSKGIHDFPDPNAQGQLRLPTVAAAGVDIHSREFLDAATACAGVTHGQITAAQIRAGVNGTQ